MSPGVGEGGTSALHTPLYSSLFGFPVLGGSISQFSNWLVLENQQGWGDLRLPPDAKHVALSGVRPPSSPPCCVTWGS